VRGHSAQRDHLPGHTAVLSQTDRGLEEALHLEGGGHADAHGRALLTPVFELVCLAPPDDHNVTGLGVDLLEAPAEADVPGEDLEPLLLVGVHVHPGHCSVWGQLDVDFEVLATRVGGGLAEGDPLAAYRVHDGLSCVCHLVAPWSSVGATSLGSRGRRVVGQDDDLALLKVDDSEVVPAGDPGTDVVLKEYS
jgi:hypothetical protein